MKTLQALLDEKLADEEFRDLFECECHVCCNTVRVIERLDSGQRSLAAVAAELGVDPSELQLLADADYCDPELVVRLCQLLGLPVPTNCPRRPIPV